MGSLGDIQNIVNRCFVRGLNYTEIGVERVYDFCHDYPLNHNFKTLFISGCILFLCGLVKFFGKHFIGDVIF